MKKRIALILLALMLLIPEAGLANVSAYLNQKMATRSGPGTKYTEELGTLSQSTPITVVAQIETGGTIWYQVEFTLNSKLYRTYTGKKRVNASGFIPWESPDYTEDTLTAGSKAYYGPGEQYAARRKSVGKNASVRVFGVEGNWALCEYREENKWARGYIHVDHLANTVALRLPPSRCLLPPPLPPPGALPSISLTGRGISAPIITAMPIAMPAMMRILP